MPSHKKSFSYSSHPNHAARMAHAKAAQQFKTYDTSYIRPKQKKGPLIALAVCAVLVLGLLIWGVLTLTSSCSASPELLPEDEQATIVVSQGASAQTIASDLQKAGLIATTNEFISRVNEMDASAALLPGTYVISGGTSLDAIIAKLMAGPDADGIALTIPEGFTLSAIASRVEEVTSGSVTADDFTLAASDASVYATDFPFLADAGTNSLEGFLFPKTYSLKDGVTADSIIRMMLSQYQTEIASLDFSYATSCGLTNYDALVLASIVEKESPDDVDVRAKVAAVFYNRLTTDGAPAYGYLGSDATTAYELGGDVSGYDWTTQSPYNTRVTKGLPPTPICSPSLGSLEAVCSPAADFGDYYFFSFWENDSGETEYFFDKTYEDHQATIAAHS